MKNYGENKQKDFSITCDMNHTFPKSIWKDVPGVQERGVEATQICKSSEVFNSYGHDYIYIYVTVKSRSSDNIVQGD